MDISVVVPVYGCPEALPELHDRLTDTLKKLTDEFEIILVNDACPRNSWEVVQKLCERDKKTVGLELSRNFGQLKAIVAGLEYSTGKWVVVMDCDLQDRPEEILNLYKKAQEGYDAVFARRKVRHDAATKIFVSECFYKVYSYATGIKYDPALCNYSISSRQVIENFLRMREWHRAFVMYIQWMGFRTTAIDVDHNERFAGESGYNFKKRMQMATEILTSQSDKLLKLMAMFGFCISGLSLLFILFIIVQYFAMHIQPGWSSLIASIFLMGGLTITSVGIVGIYVGNIFMEVKHRPLYIVRTALNVHNDKTPEQE